MHYNYSITTTSLQLPLPKICEVLFEKREKDVGLNIIKATRDLSLYLGLQPATDATPHVCEFLRDQSSGLHQWAPDRQRAWQHINHKPEDRNWPECGSFPEEETACDLPRIHQILALTLQSPVCLLFARCSLTSDLLWGPLQDRSETANWEKITFVIDLMQIWRLLISINWISSTKEMNPITRTSIVMQPSFRYPWQNATLTKLTSAYTGFHLLITTPHTVTSSPALHISTRSSSRTTHMKRGIVPTASFWTCSWIFSSW